ncbi:MAG: hypothetical protein Q4B60_07540 [Erysipelotrichaceae bacterium]|nr:hypothetical protein [Erysipelotrichaceae bacterium]
MKNELKSITKELFSIDYNKQSLCEETEKKYQQEAKNMINKFGWKEVYDAWYLYLKDDCKTPEKAINWAKLFWWYTSCQYRVEKPYELLARLYSIINVAVDKYDCENLLYSISISLLEPMGYIDLYNDPYYEPLEDTRLLSEIEKFNKK